MNETDRINADLSKVTIVQRLEFRTNLETGWCSLVLELVDERCPTVRIVVEADQVSEWSIKNFGGGITQLLCLRARDVASLQHDRVRFVLEDLEKGALSLKCDALVVRIVPADL